MGGVSGTPWSPPLPPGPPAGPPAPPGTPALPAPRAPPAAATPPAPSAPARPPALSLLLLLLLALQSVLLAYLLLRRHASALREYKGVLLAYLARGKAWRCLHCTPPDHDATRPADAGAAAGAAEPPHAQQHAPRAGLLAALRHRCAPCLARLPCLAPLARAPSAPVDARGTPAEQAPPRAVPRSPPTRAGVTVPVTMRPEPPTSAAGDSGRTPLLPPRTVRSDAELGSPSSGARSRASTPQQALVDVELQLRRLKLNQTLRLLSC